MASNFRQIGTAHEEHSLQRMAKLLHDEWITEALAAVREGRLSREQYMPKVLQIAEELIVDMRLEYIAEIVDKFELTPREAGTLKEELMTSLRHRFLGLMHTRGEEGVAGHIMKEYLHTHRIMDGLGRAFGITDEEFAREADQARKIFESRRE